MNWIFSKCGHISKPSSRAPLYNLFQDISNINGLNGSAVGKVKLGDHLFSADDLQVPLHLSIDWMDFLTMHMLKASILVGI